MTLLSRWALWGLCSLLAASPAALAQTATKKTDPDGRRAFEIADLYRAQTVEAEDVHPDGGRVALALRHYRLEEGKSWSDLWLVDAASGEARQMTFGESNDGTPLFSPDGKQLLFTSDRDDTSQLWLMAVDGGGPRQLTHFSMGLADPVWSPDGRWIAASSEVYPECGADSACNEDIESKWQDGPLSAHMADHLLYRHWTAWADGKVSHVLLVDAQTGEVVKDLTPGHWPSPTFSLGDGPGYAFSPDSKELCFVSNHDDDPASSTNADLWTVPVDAETITPETAVNLTADNDGWDFGPVYSPDGRYIAYRSMAQPGYEADYVRLAIYDRQKKSSVYLTGRETTAPPATAVQWLPGSSDTLLFQAEEEGRNPLFRIARADGTFSKLFRDASIDLWQPVAGDRVLYVRRSADHPTELFAAALDGSGRRQLTHFNQELVQEVDLRPVEDMWLPGDGGRPIHLFLIKPHDFDPAKRYPLILNVHGGPQSQWMDNFRGDWQVYPGKGYVLAFANPAGSTGYGQDFTDAIGCDWGGRVFRDLMAVTDGLEKLPYVDPQRMGAMGWSYGGYMMMWFEGHTDRFKAIASMMGLYDLPSFYGATEELWFPERDLCGMPWSSDDYQRWSPSASATKFKTPTLVITGEKDYRVPYTQSLQFFTALQRQGVPSRLVVFPNAGHWPSWYEMAFYYTVHLDWFHRYLGGGEAPWTAEDFLRNRVFSDEKGGDGAVPAAGHGG
ncbi:MAG: S9 family peptidase [Acidobacteria bacterium]|nr:S9 family peptidase [Acidobacteriota bacterium]